MNAVRPHRLAWIGSALHGLIWTIAAGAAVYSLFAFLIAFEDAPLSIQKNWCEGQIALTGAVTALGLLGILRLPGAYRHERYEIGARELVKHAGWLWRSTETVPLAAIASIDVADGPWTRLLDVRALRLKTNDRAGTVTLRAVADAESLRRHLIGRRDALREAALLGQHSIALEPRDLLLERLCAALERLRI